MLSKKQYEALFLLFMAAILVSLPYLTSRPQIAHHKLLVATENLRDGIFDKTIVFVLRHDSTGAMGLILNRPGRDENVGGPVQDNAYYTVHSTDVRADNTMVMKDIDLAMTEGESFARGEKKPKEYVVLKGYTGWGMNQLDREISSGAWKVVAFDRDLVFHTDPAAMWNKAVSLPAVAPAE